MKPEHYRIGNIFQDKEGRIAEITMLRKITRSNKDEDNVKIQAIHGGLTSLPCTPLPLTDKTATQLGFTPMESDIPTMYKRYGKYYPEDDDYEHAFLIFKDAAGIWYRVIDGKKHEFHFVHQLQNKFFNASEEELIFNCE